MPDFFINFCLRAKSLLSFHSFCSLLRAKIYSCSLCGLLVSYDIVFEVKQRVFRYAILVQDSKVSIRSSCVQSPRCEKKVKTLCRSDYVGWKCEHDFLSISLALFELRNTSWWGKVYKFDGCEVHNRNLLASLSKTFTSSRHNMINDIQNLAYDKWNIRNTYDLYWRSVFSTASLWDLEPCFNYHIFCHFFSDALRTFPKFILPKTI